MNEQKVLDTIQWFADRLPKFNDGRINYANAGKAPVINVFIECGGEILLLKRSDKVRAYQGKWNSLGGYLDEVKPLRQKVLEELQEELGITESMIQSIDFGEPFEFIDSDIKKTWIIHPALAHLKEKPHIKLDWEHTEYRWIKPEELINFETVSKLDQTLKKVL